MPRWSSPLNHKIRQNPRGYVARQHHQYALGVVFPSYFASADYTADCVANCLLLATWVFSFNFPVRFPQADRSAGSARGRDLSPPFWQKMAIGKRWRGVWRNPVGGDFWSPVNRVNDTHFIGVEIQSLAITAIALINFLEAACPDYGHYPDQQRPLVEPHQQFRRPATGEWYGRYCQRYRCAPRFSCRLRVYAYQHA